MNQPCRTRFLGLLLAALAPAALAQAPLQAAASAADGSYSLASTGDAAPALRATAAVMVAGRWLHAADYPQHLVTTAEDKGELGAARATTVRYTGLAHAPDLLVTLRTYAGGPYGDIVVAAHNTTGAPCKIGSLRLLESAAKPGDAGILVNLGGPASSDRVLSDSFSEDRPAMQLRDLTDAENRVHRAVGAQLIYNQQSRKSWFLGALSSDKFLSVLRLRVSPQGAMQSYEVDSTGTTELLRENSLADSPEKDRVPLSLELAPGGTLRSERMLFSIATDYHAQLETYARLIRGMHHARVSAPTPIGWWSWTAYYFGLNQGAALANAQWLSEHLRSSGYTFFHIDEGYQFARGEYATPDAVLFPEGLGALEHEVLHLGLTPGVWTAPFEVSERSWVYTHHPEWLVHNAAGEPIHIGVVTQGLDHLYALDPTHPGAQAYLRSTYSTLVRQWGVRYIKMDFMEDSAVEGIYHTPQTTALEAQRVGLQTIRDAVGPNVLLDKDGCEMLNPVGLVDMGRISQDTGHTFSASRDAAAGIAARYYMNRNYYVADPDAFSVSTQTVDDQHWHGGTKPLTLEEARVSIALSAVSGGLFEEGDDLPTLGADPERAALVENRDLLDMARLGRASVPLDLMSYAAADRQPSIFLLKETGRQSVLTVFNWTDGVRQHSLPRAALGLDPAGSYTVTELLAGSPRAMPLRAALTLAQPPHSVRIFRIVDTTIPAQPPFANAAVPRSGAAGNTLAFSAAAQTDSNPVLRYTWDFGDGVTAEGANASHAYTHAGAYTVRLTTSGFAPQSHDQSFSVQVAGSVATRFLPKNKRRFPQAEP